MLEAAEHGALDRRRFRIIGIDLDDPAEAVELVRVPGRVEALVVRRPAVEAALLHAPALLVRVELVAAVEVVREVLFARQVGAPRRLAGSAVVEGAEHAAALRIGRGAQQRVAGGRPADREWRGGGEAARVAAGPHHLPAGAAAAAGIALQLDLDHRDAVCRLRLADLLRGPVLEAIGVQQAVVDVLMVRRQQAAPRAVERVVVHAVVVHAHLHGLVGGAVAGVWLPRRHRAGDAHRLAPRRDRLGDITFGHHQRVGTGRRHALEAEPCAAARRCAAAERSRQRRVQRRRRGPGAEPQQMPPRRVANLMDARVERAVAVLHRVEVLRHRRLLVLLIGRRRCYVLPARGPSGRVAVREAAARLVAQVGALRRRALPSSLPQASQLRRTISGFSCSNSCSRCAARSALSRLA